ncbi:MAG: hypothetical protein HN909_01450 [Phycisphaerales bacterium]|jgi:hypothetical protein|nr:hypothetical protein [Phycisphaerales bacterium]MBT7170413.1 hypothetical protein [Phycisphaerales bacterium]
MKSKIWVILAVLVIGVFFFFYQRPPKPDTIYVIHRPANFQALQSALEKKIATAKAAGLTVTQEEVATLKCYQTYDGMLADTIDHPDDLAGLMERVGVFFCAPWAETVRSESGAAICLVGFRDGEELWQVEVYHDGELIWGKYGRPQSNLQREILAACKIKR